jgi:hypothetical protein
MMLHLQQRAGARAPVKAAASSSSPPSPPSSSSPSSKARATAKPQQRRSAKDPSQFPSYDAIRAHLHRDNAQQPGFISGLLNGLSDRAFGYGGRGGLGAALYRAFVRFGGAAGPLARPSDNNTDDSSLLDTSNAQPTEQSDALAALLMISRTRAAALARRHPSLLAVPPAELGRRVLALKSALPGCDVAALVEARPDLYLLEEGGGAAAARGAAAEAEAQEEQQRPPKDAPATTAGAAATAGRALAALREGLPGADADMVAFEDPALLFHPYDKLRRGLRRLRALWPSADEQALAASEPRHLALAVRALGEGQGDDEGAEEDRIG